jgi:hypothetical protein
MPFRIAYALVFAVALLGQPAPSRAATITTGTPLPLTAASFALPISAIGAVALASWQFDVRYDPDDVQIDTACIPLVDDYCDFLTGPISEGDFFSAGTPFNLFNPGIVVIDALTQLQSGRLLGVQGAYGGFPPPPSGAGVIAYVRFVVVGDGTSPITIENAATLSAVSEPVSVLSLAAALSVMGAWRLRGRVRARCDTHGPGNVFRKGARH